MIQKPHPMRRVLLVDDEPLTRTLISEILRTAGHETVEAGSAQEALRIAPTFLPDLALLDVMMPDMSGIELAERFNAELGIPFMFISAHGEAEIVRQATDHGAVGYLLKPFDVAQVIPAFEAALGRADEIRCLRQNESNLSIALNEGRETSMAIGLLMAKFETDRETALEILRTYSRSSRYKMNEIAKNLLDAEELFNKFRVLFSRHEHK